MAMALIQRRVSADAVEVSLASHVPGPHALGALDHDRQRVVIRRADAIRRRNDARALAHSVYLPGAPLVRARICRPNKLSTSSTASSAVRLPSSYAGFSSVTSSEPMRFES